MLVVPTLENLQRRNFPYITTALIIINCLVYFVIQAGDDKRFQDALDLYIDSGLLAIESRVYTDFQQQQGEDVTIPEILPDDRERLYGFSWDITSDTAFQNLLKNGALIRTANEQYQEWRVLRDQYESMLARVVFLTHGFKTAWPTWLTAFTSMFLHGDFWHLAGNMIFLFMAGVVLESVMGSPVFLLSYLAVGLVESWMTVPFSVSAVPSIGASGAISGIMGTYSVVMGLTRVPIFYSLGFYFGNARLPALLLLFFWIGKEFYFLFLGEPSNTNYAAHIAGFIAGGLIGFCFRLAKGGAGDELFINAAKEQRKKSNAALEKGLGHMSEFQFSKARKSVLQALEHDPQAPDLLIHLFNIDKQQPESREFRKTVVDLLSLLAGNSRYQGQTLDIYKEYIHLCPDSNLPPELQIRIVLQFAAGDEVEEALTVLSEFMCSHPDHLRIPECLLMCGRACFKKSLNDKGKKCLTQLCQQFPDSMEAGTAKQILTTGPEQKPKVRTVSQKKICCYHPTRHAYFSCGECNKLFCGQCVCTVKDRSQVNHSHYMCPKCNVELSELGVAHTIEPFWKRISLFFRYPFQRTPLVLIGFLSLLCAAGWILMSTDYWIFLFLYYVLYLGVVPLVQLYYCNGVFDAASKGSFSKAPKWEDVDGSIAQTFKQFFVLLGLFVLGNLFFFCDGDFTEVVSVIVLLLQPAVMMTMVADKGVLQALNPIFLVRLIHRIGRSYLLLLLFVYLLFNAPFAIALPFIDKLPGFISMLIAAAAWQYYLIVIYNLLGYVILQYHTALGFQIDYSEFIKRDSAGKQETHKTKCRLLPEVDALVREGRKSDALELIRATTGGEFDNADLGVRCTTLLEQCGQQDVLPVVGRNVLDLLMKEKRRSEGMALYKKCFREDKAFSPNGETLYWLFTNFDRSDEAVWAARTGIQFIKAMPRDDRVPECQLRCAELIADQLNQPVKAEKLLLNFQKRFPGHVLNSQAAQRLNDLLNKGRGQ